MLRRKSSRIAVLILALALGASTLAGCGNSSSNNSATDTSVPQVIKYNLAAEPKTVDPALNDAVDGATVIANAFEGLTRTDDKDNVVPGIATSWDVSSDGLTYTFHLRKDATWTDGVPVKASDFEYAWKRALDPATASDYAYQLYYLKNGEAFNEKKATIDQVGVQAVDDQTLKVTLQYPTAYFLSLMAFPTYMPVRKDIVEKNPSAWATKPETYVTDGPFKMKEWLPKDKLVFVKNDKYWNAKAIKLNEIDYGMIDQETSYMAAFQTGQFDFIESPPAQQVPELLKSGVAKTFPYLGTYYLELNLTPAAGKIDPAAAKAISDVRVRQALALAIDRTALVNDVTKGGQIPATSFVPKGIPEDKNGTDFHKKDYYPANGDIAKAQQLLADAGYPGGKGFPSLVYLYNTGQGHQDIAQAIQDMWRKNLGINIQLQNQEWKVFQTTRTSKQYEIARGGWIADYTDPMTFLDLFTSQSGNNDPGYNSAAYDAKVTAAKNEMDVAKRMQDMHDAEDILMNDMPEIPLYYYTNVVCIKDYVKGVHLSPLGFVFFYNSYVTKH